MLLYLLSTSFLVVAWASGTKGDGAGTHDEREGGDTPCIPPLRETGLGGGGGGGQKKIKIKRGGRGRTNGGGVQGVPFASPVLA